jgi:hypothetical protein
VAYSQTLAATGGNGTLVWSLDSGSLPAGLSLSSGGVISGTPTGTGTSNFTVRVADSDGTEVYPDSPRVTDQLCNRAQVAAVCAGLVFVLAR